MSTEWGRLFDPATIAVVGASSNRGKIGGRVLSNLSATFRGDLVGVNPAGRSLDGVETVRSISELSQAPDVAYVAVPRPHVVEAVSGLAAAGAGFVSIFTSGFAETSAGAALQEDLAEAVRGSDTRLLGPNCVGTVAGPRAANGTFGVIEPTHDAAANIALVSQSGALGLQILGAVQDRGRSLAHMVTTGNEVDVTASEAALAALQRAEVEVVGLVLESLGSPAELFAVADAASELDKSVVVLRTGRYRSGQRAATSHTGAIAVPDRLMTALVSELGLVDATGLGDFVRMLCTISVLGRPRGDRVGVVTGSGGLGIIAADAADAHALRLPGPGPALGTYLASVLPAFASAANPIDYTAHLISDVPAMSEITATVAESGDYDLVCVAQIPLAPADIAGSGLIRRLRAQDMARVICCTQDAAVVRTLGAARIAAAYDPAEALSLYARYREASARSRERGVRGAPPGLDGAAGARYDTLDADASRDILQPLGLEWPAEALVQDADAAVAFLAGLPAGTSVALKADPADIGHKSERNALRLGLAAAEDVRAAHEDLTQSLGVATLVVQEMIAGELEIVLGGLRDDRLGPFVLFGLGGREVEIIGEQALMPAPCTRDDAVRLVGAAHGGRLIGSPRGLLPAQVDSLVDAVHAMGRLLREKPEVREVDVNPIIVSGDRMVAVDALVSVVRADR